MPEATAPRDLLVRALARRGALSLVTRPFGNQLLGAQPDIDEVFGLDTPNRGRGRIGGLLLGGHRRSLGRTLAGRDFDRVLIYDVERNVIRDWLEGLFPRRVVEMRHEVAPGEHVSELYRRAAESAGCDMAAYDPVPVLEVPDELVAQARGRLHPLGQRLIGVQMGSQRTTVRSLLPQRPNLKSLTGQQWQSLVVGLLEDDAADSVVLHGSSAERSMVESFRNGLPATIRSRCHDLTDLPLRLLPAVLSQLHALISVDTGPAHIAAAVGCPVLAIFGPTDPARYRPLGHGVVELLVGSAPCQFCHPTRQYKRCRDNICLNRLGDAQIRDAWERLAARIAGSSGAGS
jgi:ADP-heptose:LPS heptosyltransferase